MISSYTHRLLIASKVKGVGRKTLYALARDRLFFELEVDDLAESFTELASMKKGSQVYNYAMRAADFDISEAERRGHHIVSTLDSTYPKMMLDLSDRPAILYVSGDPRKVSEKALSVIGTRDPTLHGGLTAHRLTTYFSEQGWQIVSGLALGIDTIAHEATVRRGGSTVAVLAHGLDMIYPAQNRKLAAELVESDGLLISEYPYGSKVFPGQFVERDRIQAALTRGVVMVQSDEHGGSWHASRAALRYERYLFVPEPTADDRFNGAEKIRGNLKVLEGPKTEAAVFLKCTESQLEKVIPVRSKDDYARIESVLVGNAPAVAALA